MNKQAVIFLGTVLGLIALALLTLVGLALNLAFAHGVGSAIIATVVVAVPVALSGIFGGPKRILQVAIAVLVMTEIVYLLGHISISLT
jgi:amino acid permease